MSRPASSVRRLMQGNPLWLGNPALADLDPARDRMLMSEAVGESTSVWSDRARIALFLAAMRHFRDKVH